MHSLTPPTASLMDDVPRHDDFQVSSTLKFRGLVWLFFALKVEPSHVLLYVALKRNLNGCHKLHGHILHLFLFDCEEWHL